MVYGIGLHSRSSRRAPPGIGPGGLQAALMADLPDPGLALVAQQTGGGYIELRPNQDLGAAFAGVIDELPVEGFRLRETALLYRPARTLVVADLVHNVGRPTHRWSVVYTRLMGFYDQVALSRVIRWTGFTDKSATRRSIDAALAHPFDRLVVGHGDPLPAGGRDAFAAAYGRLKG